VYILYPSPNLHIYPPRRKHIFFCKSQLGLCFHEREPGDQKDKPTQPENRGSKEGTRERPILVK